MTKIKVKEGDKVGGFSVSSPWDEDVPLLIEEAVVRNFDGELWAEHIKPQFDYTEIKDTEKWVKYLLRKNNDKE